MVSRENIAVCAVLAGGAAVGVVTDTVNWPVDDWLVVEAAYVAIVGFIVGTIRDIRRWRDRGLR